MAKILNYRPVGEHPIKQTQAIAEKNSWKYASDNPEEISVWRQGRWQAYHHLLMRWLPSSARLEVLSFFDLSVTKEKRAAIYELLALINERMHTGCFSIFTQNGLVLFRHDIILSREGLKRLQLEEFLNHAMEVCELYFPAFQLVLWANKSPKQALNAEGPLQHNHG